MKQIVIILLIFFSFSAFGQLRLTQLEKASGGGYVPISTTQGYQVYRDLDSYIQDTLGLGAQTLSFSNPNLSISGGNSEDISGVNYWTKAGTEIYYNDNIGFGNVTNPAYEMDGSGEMRIANATDPTFYVLFEPPSAGGNNFIKAYGNTNAGIWWGDMENLDGRWRIGMSSTEDFAVRDVTSGNIDAFLINQGAPLKSFYLKSDGSLEMWEYGVGSFAGSVDYLLGVNSSGQVLEATEGDLQSGVNYWTLTGNNVRYDNSGDVEIDNNLEIWETHDPTAKNGFDGTGPDNNSIFINGISTARPEINFYRSSRSYPQFGLKMTGADEGGVIYGGDGLSAPNTQSFIHLYDNGTIGFNEFNPSTSYNFYFNGTGYFSDDLELDGLILDKQGDTGSADDVLVNDGSGGLNWTPVPTDDDWSENVGNDFYNSTHEFGIGTDTSPDALLEIRGDSGTQLLKVSADSGDGNVIRADNNEIEMLGGVSGYVSGYVEIGASQVIAGALKVEGFNSAFDNDLKVTRLIDSNDTEPPDNGTDEEANVYSADGGGLDVKPIGACDMVRASSAISAGASGYGTSFTKFDFNSTLGNDPDNGLYTVSTGSDNITLNEAGQYRIEAQIKLGGVSTDTDAVIFAFHKNDAAWVGSTQYQTFYKGSFDLTVYMYIIDEFAAGDVIDLRYKDENGSNDDVPDFDTGTMINITRIY